MARKSKINIADFKGLMKLVAEATVNITDVVEEMNHRVVHPPFFKSTPIQQLISGISGIVFSTVRFTTKVVGKGVDKSLSLLNPQLGFEFSSDKKDKLLSILNGVIGDHLVEQKNELATTMELRFKGESIEASSKNLKAVFANSNGKILLMVHGLCMNDKGWTYQNHNHGKVLSKKLAYTTIHLNYNSGLPISTNGQKFSEMMNQFVANYPKPIEEIIVIAHSMGGLVSRSGFFYGQEREGIWTQKVKKMIFLGSPHHGAPLEKLGNYIDHIFDALHYVKPFSRLAKIRSAGITDLRYGNLLESDWKGVDRFKKNKNKKTTVPLPDQLESYTIAGTMGKESDKVKKHLLGDGLVLLNSALGKDKKQVNLDFKTSNTFISYETNHMELLSNQQVYEQIEKWLR